MFEMLIDLFFTFTFPFKLNFFFILLLLQTYLNYFCGFTSGMKTIPNLCSRMKIDLDLTNEKIWLFKKPLVDLKLTMKP